MINLPAIFVSNLEHFLGFHNELPMEVCRILNFGKLLEDFHNASPNSHWLAIVHLMEQSMKNFHMSLEIHQVLPVIISIFFSFFSPYFYINYLYWYWYLFFIFYFYFYIFIFIFIFILLLLFYYSLFLFYFIYYIIIIIIIILLLFAIICYFIYYLLFVLFCFVFFIFYFFIFIFISILFTSVRKPNAPPNSFLSAPSNQYTGGT